MDYQEVVLGSEKAVTLCGARCFPTAKLLTFGSRMGMGSSITHSNSLFYLGQGSTDAAACISVKAYFDGLGKLRDLRQLQVNLETITKTCSPSSTFWFRTASTNFATDPRDLVYGMRELLPTQSHH